MAEPKPGRAQDPGAHTPIRRSRDDRWLLGVCAGLARHFRTPSWRVRLLWVLSGVVTLGLAAVAYFVLANVLPEEQGGRGE